MRVWEFYVPNLRYHFKYKEISPNLWLYCTVVQFGGVSPTDLEEDGGSDCMFMSC